MTVMRILSLAAVATAAVLPSPSRAADIPWDWATRCSRQTDFDALHPLIQQMLTRDPVGTVRSWASKSGRHGHVTLVSGGDAAASTVAVVRITIGTAQGERPFFTFRYRKDPKRGWAVCG